MKYISHRGNINGRIEESENRPDFIDDALKLGFDVEVDVWCVNDRLYLGHDNPENLVGVSWILERSKNLWVHCKNLESVVFLQSLGNDNIHYFWHQEDCITLTSKNYIWAFPGKQPIKNSIAVMPEINNDDVSNCIGICSDKIGDYKLKINNTNKK
jgi:hypothetical protein